jgi:uncharacterized damage-inducible protein DinB
MEWIDLLTDGYGRIMEQLSHALKGLDQEDLNWQPKPDCNSMGWLTWHLTRQQDAQISSLMSEEQLWIRGEWYSRFDRPADPDDSGFGDTPKQVAAFKSPDVKTLLGYQRAVLERSQKYFATLSKDDLDRELNEPWFKPLPTVGVRLISILGDSLMHAGQIAYVRGLRQGKGWQKY